MIMKLPIIIVAGTLTAAIAYNAYALTCGAQPSCADLGYTLTSSDDCLGIVLKCPFDKSKLFCTKKSEVFQNMTLDWSKKITISYNQVFNVTKYGCNWGNIIDSGNGVSYYAVNDVKIRASAQGDEMSLIFTCVSPGDRVTATVGSIYDNRLYFIPYKGN